MRDSLKCFFQYEKRKIPYHYPSVFTGELSNTACRTERTDEAAHISSVCEQQLKEAGEDVRMIFTTEYSRVRKHRLQLVTGIFYSLQKVDTPNYSVRTVFIFHF